MKSNFSNSIEKIKNKLSGTSISVLIVFFVLIVIAVYNVDFFASLPQIKSIPNSEKCSCPNQKMSESKPNNTQKTTKSKPSSTPKTPKSKQPNILVLPCLTSPQTKNDQILKAATKNCKKFNSSLFENDQSILGTTTQGRLGSQMNDFATRYSLNIMSGGKLRVSQDQTQFKMMAPIFPYFEKYAENHLLKSWYCDPQSLTFERLNINNGRPLEEMKQEMVKIGKDFHHGHAYYVPSDTGLPLVFKPQYNELRDNVFKIRQCYVDKAQEIIDVIWSLENQNFSAVIGN